MSLMMFRLVGVTLAVVIALLFTVLFNVKITETMAVASFILAVDAFLNIAVIKTLMIQQMDKESQDGRNS